MKVWICLILCVFLLHPAGSRAPGAAVGGAVCTDWSPGSSSEAAAAEHWPAAAHFTPGQTDSGAGAQICWPCNFKWVICLYTVYNELSLSLLCFYAKMFLFVCLFFVAYIKPKTTAIFTSHFMPFLSDLFLVVIYVLHVINFPMTCWRVPHRSVCLCIYFVFVIFLGPFLV